MVARDQGIEIVLRILGIKPARQPYRAEDVGGEWRLHTTKGVFDKSIVKARVMRHEQTTFESCQHLAGQSFKGRCIRHHRVRDARKCLNFHRDGALRIHQTLPLFDDDAVIDQHDADFGNAVACRGDTGCFQINDGDF